MAFALSVNLNKIALIRNSRVGNYPDVCNFGRICLTAGAAGLTVHPRPDQRHIRPGDVTALAALLQEFPDREFNIEGNPFAPTQGSYPGLLALVKATQPQQCTLVPDSSAQLTSDHGFDLVSDGKKLTPIIQQLRAQGVRVSLFMDPDLEQISRAKDLGADRIELYTGPYAEAFLKNPASIEQEYSRYAQAAAHTTKLGLGVNAGHDLNLQNLVLFSKLPGLLEVSIGHALMVESLTMGMANTVAAYLKICGVESKPQ